MTEPFFGGFPQETSGLGMDDLVGGLITTHAYHPLRASRSIELTAIPNRLLGIDSSAALRLDPLVGIDNPLQIPAAVLTLLRAPSQTADEESLREDLQALHEHHLELGDEYFLSPLRLPLTFPTDAERLDIAFAILVSTRESVLVEESPPRRTSPVALQAGRIGGGILASGATGVGSYLATGHGDPVVIISGGATTLVLALAGSTGTILNHWLARRLGL